MGHLFSYRVYSQSMVIEMSKIALFVLSADDYKKTVRVWANHLSASER